MANSKKCVGYKRRAKFGPGAELSGITNGKLVNCIVLEVSRLGLLKIGDSPIYYYRVYDKDSKNIHHIMPPHIERLEQIGLLNIGTLRTLFDDAPFDGPDEPSSPNPPVPRGLTELDKQKKVRQDNQMNILNLIGNFVLSLYGAFLIRVKKAIEVVNGLVDAGKKSSKFENYQQQRNFTWDKERISEAIRELDGKAARNTSEYQPPFTLKNPIIYDPKGTPSTSDRSTSNSSKRRKKQQGKDARKRGVSRVPRGTK